MFIPEYIVDLDVPPAQRWSFLSNLKPQINELLRCYLNDYESAAPIFENIGLYKHAVIAPAYLQEVASIAALTGFSEDEVLIANLYYDILKFYFGCTAFAVYNGKTLYHARNLDWHTQNNLLSRHTCIFNFYKSGRLLFSTVGWPGFIGALSGMKPGAFAVTLNAVSSYDAPELATPISFFLRDVLEQAPDFVTARKQLEQTVIASDCLLLLSGTDADEKVVIERTPRRHATRGTDGNFLAVTNNYWLLDNQPGEDVNELSQTSCDRHDRALALLRAGLPADASGCMNILKDDEVQMGITVQQMVFDTKAGRIDLELHHGQE